ncbi:hypothetical protein BJF93_05270 [Xaviernesmea oryzae]|uniref:Uncharacterized protein n=1 Tax=Xaviernesmea oryzae TaxID=464029 RepID=A0A1Q9ARL9_9HYPH|nr:hypothetical protein [Xaviernesmea oryzae]OLP58050.1 hypothetical protein BJF93_05270 [Xaviernesmea oryzae]SEL84335.1 hypothetical protein SAMN04487976_113151 [Xaviernesmea oryzae]
MILEALNYAATAALTPAAFRPFIGGSIRLWARARRCARDWAPHEAQCHRAVEEMVATLKQRRTVVVLGSGLLRDVPVKTLSRAFDTVVLVDLVHLASVRAWLTLNGIRNAKLISRDLSGDQEGVNSAAEPLAFLRQVPTLDLVISANILSQMPIGRRRSFEARNLPVDEAALSGIIAAHLQGLSMLPCRRLLLTDTDYTVRNRQGQVLEHFDLLLGQPAPAASRSWAWTVAPFGEEGREIEIIHRAIAAEDPGTPARKE